MENKDLTPEEITFDDIQQEIYSTLLGLQVEYSKAKMIGESLLLKMETLVKQESRKAAREAFNDGQNMTKSYIIKEIREGLEGEMTPDRYIKEKFE